MTDIDELREDFDYNDANGDGRLDRDEFAQFMRGLEAGASREQVAIGFDDIDRDNDGYIEFEEFVAWWESR